MRRWLPAPSLFETAAGKLYKDNGGWRNKLLLYRDKPETYGLKILVLETNFGVPHGHQKSFGAGREGFVGTYIVNRLSQRGIEPLCRYRRRGRTKALIISPASKCRKQTFIIEETGRIDARSRCGH